MSLLSASEVHKVIRSSTVSDIAGEWREVAKTTVSSLVGAETAWRGLTGDTLTISSSDFIPELLQNPVVESELFASSLYTAATTFENHVDELAAQKTVRDGLLEDIEALNLRYETALTALASARAAAAGASDDDRAGAEAAVDRAQQEVDAIIAEVEALREEIASFNRDVEETEENLAEGLRSTLGTEVTDVGDKPVSHVNPDANWGPGAGSFTAAGNFTDVFHEGMFDRINQLSQDGKHDPEGVSNWLRDNPEFTAAIQFISPERGEQYWNGLVSDAGEFTELSDLTGGDLVVLVNAAPLVLGNMPGVPIEHRATLNESYLQQESRRLRDLKNSGVTLTEEQNAILSTSKVLRDSQDAHLLNLFWDRDEPRAAIAYGDVTTADAVMPVTHGIRTDLSQVEDWSDSAANIRLDVEAALRRAGNPGTVATVAWFGYDSKGAGDVQSVEHAQVGAERLFNFVNSVQYENPNAIYMGSMHSYGTTTAGELVKKHPELFDVMFFHGSAGVSREAEEVFLNNPDAPDVWASRNSNAWSSWLAGAEPDLIAPLGRIPGISEHPVDPVDSFAQGRELPTYGGDVTYGDGYVAQDTKPVTGHDSQAKTTTTQIREHGEVIAEYESTTYGYLSPEASSYHHMINQTAQVILESQR